ncbi:mitochondrial inner membrane protease subunit 1 isoform X2 [Coturnix japonica]|uniref:mitochondrial inner membrane protease subunit 1 isoform X2 n=1 Tax=Coturnix japonica TaxID=93934 RepID=UPI00077711B9|nr:mitochondrial inner membrane protease subunit 1 isoform X2 [Coturnix japonica]
MAGGSAGAGPVTGRSVLDLQWNQQFKILILSFRRTLADTCIPFGSMLLCWDYILHLVCQSLGDIVIVKNPTDPKSNICKRVIGLEGDKVCASNPSDFLKTHSFVPKGHVWLEGDNLRNSTDSRCYGPVPYGLIRGRICFKIWPLNDFGFLRASPNGHRFLDD